MVSESGYRGVCFSLFFFFGLLDLHLGKTAFFCFWNYMPITPFYPADGEVLFDVDTMD